MEKNLLSFCLKKDVTTDLLGFMEVNDKLTIGERLASFINLICILQQADSMQFLTMKVAYFRVYYNASNDSYSRWHIAIKEISKGNKCISIVRSYKENLLENIGFRVFLIFLSSSNQFMLELSYIA